MTTKLSALPYFGGKASTARQGSGPWIASLLPQRYDVLYAEPFAGMLGVLLQRPRSAVEIVNDADLNVINWWRVVRDQPEAFGRALRYTPRSRDEYERCYQALRDDVPMTELKRALAYHTVLNQTYVHGSGVLHPSKGGQATWRRKYSPEGGNPSHWTEEQVRPLADRLAKVQLERGEAIEILERIADIEDAVVYVDPPYRDANKTAYLYDVDREALAEALAAQKGAVAISGYTDEWDVLGWHRSS